MRRRDVALSPGQRDDVGPIPVVPDDGHGRVRLEFFAVLLLEIGVQHTGRFLKAGAMEKRKKQVEPK